MNLKFSGILLLVTCTITLAQQNWTWRNPFPQGNDLKHLAYGNGLYVAVGDLGTIVTSKDRITWSTVFLESQKDLYSIGFFDSVFIAVGDSGTIVTSTDGKQWNNNSQSTNMRFCGISRGRGKFVIVAYDSAADKSSIFYSENGNKWTQTTATYDFKLSSIVFGDSTFLIGGTSDLMRSSDGVNWTRQTKVLNLAYNSLAYGQSLFVGIGHLQIYRSTDGLKWDSTSINWKHTSGTVSYSSGKFCIILHESYDQQLFMSNNGINWYNITLSTYVTSFFSHMLWRDSVGTIVGSGGSIFLNEGSASVKSSYKSITTNDLLFSAFGRNTFVAARSYGSFVYSYDGISWNFFFTGAGPSSLTFGNNRFIASGYYGSVFISDSGNKWVEKRNNIPNQYDILFSNNIFTLVGYYGAIYTSTDGNTWTNRNNAGVTDDYYDIEVGNNTLLIVGKNNKLLLSVDALSWEDISDSISATINKVYFFKNKFYLTGNNDTLLTSSDGRIWNYEKYKFPASRHKIVNNKWFCFTNSNKVFHSDDLSKWDTISFRTKNAIYDVSYGNGIYVAYGGSGTIFTSNEEGGTAVNKSHYTKENNSQILLQYKGSGLFQIRSPFSSKKLTGRIWLYEINGQAKPIRMIQKTLDMVAFRTENIASGVYFLKCELNNGVIETVKCVVLR